MAGDVSVPQLVQTLCRCILRSYEKEEKRKYLSQPLKIPYNSNRSGFYDNQTILRLLFKSTFDLLLLRKEEWCGQWLSLMTPQCRCLSHSYELYQQGEDKMAAHLVDSVTVLCEEYSDSEPVMEFLSILAQPSKIHKKAPPTSTSYTIYPNSIFQQPPPGSMLSYSNKIFKEDPGSNVSCFYSQDFSNSTLFNGLTHTTTDHLNTVLRVPPLKEEPPDLLHRYLQGYSTYHMTMPLTPPPNDIQEDSLLDVIDSVGSLDEAPPPLSWEGPLDRTCLPYLSESGPTCFHLAMKQFLSGLADIANVTIPSISRDLSPVTLFINELSACYEWAEKQKVDIEISGDELVCSFYNGVYSLLNYCQVQVDQITAQDSSQFFLQASINCLQPLIHLVSTVLTSDVSLKGLPLLDHLYNHCTNYQGLPYYPLLLGLFRQTFQPYLQFLHQWIFKGFTLSSEGFGLIIDQDSLDKRDNSYWLNGFCFKEGSVPDCLSRYETIILTAGKSLNLLRLCCPQHHLCNEEDLLPQLTLAQSLKQIQQVQQVCLEYHEKMKDLALQLKQRLAIERLERELGQQAVLARARQQARKAMIELQEKESLLMKEEVKKRKILFNELQEQAERARAFRLEAEAEEKEKDILLLKENTERETKTKELENQAREELMDYYQELTHQAELRTLRAQWRAKRFALGATRLQYLQKLSEIEEKELFDAGLMSEHSDQITENDQDLIAANNELIPKHSDQITETGVSDVYHDSIVEVVPKISDQPSSTNVQLNYGLQPQSEMASILYGSRETISSKETPLLKRGIYAPHSTIESILYGGGDHSDAPYLSSRGKAPESTIQNLMYPLALEESEDPSKSHSVKRDLRQGTRGGPPSSTIQKLLYYGRDKGDDNNSTGYETKQFIIHYPDVVPFTHYNTSFPIQNTPVSSSTLFSYADLSNIEDTIYLFSLPVLIEECIGCPLITQANLVNTALVNHFINDLEIKNHFILLKRYLLLEDGEFANVLCSKLFHQLVHGHSLDQLCSGSFLSPLLSSALEKSLTLNDTLTRNLSLTLSYYPTHLSTSSIKALDFLKLDYKVQWPLNIVINKDHIDQYNKIFQFILQIKRASWTLKNVFTTLTRGNLQETLPSQQVRLIHAQRQELQHFVTVMEGYIANQLFHLSWQEFESNLCQVISLDELIQYHDKFLNVVLFRCLLTKKALPVLTLIENALNSIMKFCCQLLLHQARLYTLTNIHYAFKESAGLLYRVIQKLVKRGYQPHLEEFLLRLNFNVTCCHDNKLVTDQSELADFLSTASTPIIPQTRLGSGKINVFTVSRVMSQVSHQDCHMHPSFKTKPVYELHCSYCDQLVCVRGMRAILLADKNVELYSTDLPPPRMVLLVGPDYQTNNCQCRIQDTACCGCGCLVGYHVTVPCQSCLRSCNNGHFWMFHSSCVHPSERLDSSGKEILVWASIPTCGEDDRMQPYEVPLVIECCR